MSILVKPVSFGGEVITVAPLLESYELFARRSLATSLCGKLVHKGGLDVTGRMIAVVSRKLFEGSSTPAGSDRTIDFDKFSEYFVENAQAMVLFATHLALLQNLDQLRAANVIWAKDELAKLLKSAVVGRTFSSATLDATLDTVLMILDNPDGSAIPASGYETVQLGTEMLDWRFPSKSALTAIEAQRLIAARSCVIDLMGHVEGLLTKERTTSVAVEDVRNVAISRKCAILREAAGSVLSRLIAAYLRQAKAICTWLSLPAVKQSIHGIEKESAARLTSFVESELVGIQTRHPTGWELFIPNCFDGSPLALYHPLLAKVPTGLVGGKEGASIPLGPMTLLADVAYPVELTPSSVSDWLSAAVFCLRQAKSGDQLMNAVIGDTAASMGHVKPATVVIPPVGDPSEPIHETGASDGYPIRFPSDRRLFIPSARDYLVPAGYSDWMIYTTAQVEQTLRAGALPLRIAPVHVRGTGSGNTIVPAFKLVAPQKKDGTFTDNSLFRFGLRQTARDLSSWFQTAMKGDALQLRQFADKLRFVGVLTVGDEGRIVIPTCDHIYHGLKFKASCFGPPIGLGKIGTGEPISFIPFKFLPASADMRTFERSLSIVQQQNRHLGGVDRTTWITKNEIEPSELEIVGWYKVGESLRDIVYVETARENVSSFTLLCDNTGVIRGLRDSNFVFSLSEVTPIAPFTTSPILGDDDTLAERIQEPLERMSERTLA